MTVLARRLEKLEDGACERFNRRWRAAIDRLRNTMDPEHAPGLGSASAQPERGGLPVTGRERLADRQRGAELAGRLGRDNGRRKIRVTLHPGAELAALAVARLV
jgi:hypothetical protein